MKRLHAGWLVVALVGTAVAGCGDASHEPVKVIAAPRPAAPPAVEVPAAPPAPASVAAAASAAPPSRPALAASRPAVVEPGVAQRTWQPGEPNGNTAFRNAIEARRAGAQTAGVPPDVPQNR